MPLVYSFVARDTTVLAEYSAYAGNFHTVALECLENLQRLEEKFTITCDTYTFNYLVDGNNFIYLVVADEAYGRQIPFAYLERLKDAFTEKFGEKGRTATTHSLDRTFGPTIKREMEYCMEHPEEISKMSAVKSKVEEVKSIMVQNVEQVLARGEKLDVLVDKTDDLRDQAQKFQRKGATLRKKMWWSNFRVQLIVVGCVLLLAVVIFLLACFTGGKNCVHGNKPPPSSPNMAASLPSPYDPSVNNALVPGSPATAASGPAASPGTTPSLPSPYDASVNNALVPGSPATAAAVSSPAALTANAPSLPSPSDPTVTNQLVPGSPPAASSPSAPSLPSPADPTVTNQLVPGTPPADAASPTAAAPVNAPNTLIPGATATSG
eukprot:jgi/Chrzof1/3441/Cz12g25160.t1